MFGDGSHQKSQTKRANSRLTSFGMRKRGGTSPVIKNLMLAGIFLLGLMLLWSCSPSGRSDTSMERKPSFLMHSFPLRQGSDSGIISMVSDKKGYIYGAGFSDEECVLVKMDPELKTLIKMVRFGSRWGAGYASHDALQEIAMDSKGNIFVAGYTEHVDYPVSGGACYDRIAAGKEGFITKFSSDLVPLASTFIGGASDDAIYGIAIDPSDEIYVTGYSKGNSDSDESFIPPSGAFDSVPPPFYPGQAKAFVAKLSNDLTTLNAATYLGGGQAGHDSDDCAYDITLDKKGNVWVTGQTQSPDFPVTQGCISCSLKGESDVFVSKLNADLTQLLASTLLGGRGIERGNAILTDQKGHIFVGGWSESWNFIEFPKGKSYDTTHSTNEADSFIVKLDTNLKKIHAATLLGGRGPATGVLQKGEDIISSMALSSDGKSLYVAGRTESMDFDTTPPSLKKHYGDLNYNHRFDRSGALEHKLDADYGDGFIARFDTDLSTRFSSTLFGGKSLEYIDDILVQGKDILVSGETHSVDFPGMVLNYGIAGTRGFISRLATDKLEKTTAKKTVPLKMQFSDEKIIEIAENVLEKTLIKEWNHDLYGCLGKYARKRISRDQFEAKCQRERYLYKGFLLEALEYAHHNYYQNHKDGYDRIDLCYGIRNAMHGGYKGSVIVTLAAKKKKWQIADITFRHNSTETNHEEMQKRLLQKHNDLGFKYFDTRGL